MTHPIWIIKSVRSIDLMLTRILTRYHHLPIVELVTLKADFGYQSEIY